MSKIIDIKQEIINKRSGVYNFSNDNKKDLEHKLKELKEEDLFNKYDMSCTCIDNELYITLIIHKSLDDMIL